ncbi:hypothetical protein M422DRAFT_23991 [Sphaerobolus stellatus SS14]|nr:hypothetical protein M422DRAFT_23991 [Sphaerobolus stellatus SS14]
MQSQTSSAQQHKQAPAKLFRSHVSDRRSPRKSTTHQAVQNPLLPDDCCAGC